MPVHVSIHDVSPTWSREFEVALAMAHEVGARPALLVVPNFHGRAPLDEAPDFCARLRELQASGHEIYLHGYFHRAGMAGLGVTADAPTTGRVRRLVAQRVVSAGEAEFSDVSRAEATRRLEAGERMLTDAGLTIDGFVAPAWSMPGWVRDLLGARGYRYTEDHLTVQQPDEGRSRPSVVLNFASRTPARLFSSVAFARVARPLRRVLPARIAIHPADVNYALLRQELRSLLAWGRGDFVHRGIDLIRTPAFAGLRAGW